MEYNVISGDSHIDMTWMPGDLWVDRAPPEFRSLAPRVIETPEGLHWEVEGKRMGVFGGTSFTFGVAARGHGILTTVRGSVAVVAWSATVVRRVGVSSSFCVWAVLS